MKKILFAILTVSIAFLASCNKKNEPENSDAPQNDEAFGTVNDICGNTYKYVKIGEQYWMAENMRCNKYDTQSERAGATLHVSGAFDPYYVDASNRSYWEEPKYAENLSDEQISSLGFFYNWTAAVGLETAYEARTQTLSFIGNRQGICPNGWHIPAIEEWEILDNFIGPHAGAKLKATSGWYNDGNGSNEYNFSALPAGNSSGGSNTYGVGCYLSLWTATPANSNDAKYYSLIYDDDGLNNYSGGKFIGLSVRCVKNDSNINNSSTSNNPSSNESLKAVSGLDASKLDNTIKKCWHCICKATITGITSTSETYLWGTEREVVLSMQNSESLSNGRARYTYEAASKDEGSCLDANNETTVSTNPLEATILRNKTYTGDFYIDDEKDDVITITFTKVSDGTLEFKATLASDEPVNGPGDVFLVGTWRLDGDLLSLYTTATYGDTSARSTESGRVENDGNKFNITAGRTAFKNMVKK